MSTKDALQEMRDRGDQWRNEVAEKSFTLSEACEKTRLPAKIFNTMIPNRQIIAVELNNKFFFPEWQFVAYCPQHRKAENIEATHFICNQVIGIWKNLWKQGNKYDAWDFVIFMTQQSAYIDDAYLTEPFPSEKDRKSSIAFELCRRINAGILMDGKHGAP